LTTTSANVVASKRSSTSAVPEFRLFCSRTSISVPLATALTEAPAVPRVSTSDGLRLLVVVSGVEGVPSEYRPLASPRA
jgi:hypothetical protein